MTRLITVSLIAWMALASDILTAQETFTLRHGFTKGSTTLFRMTAEWSETIEAMGQEQKSSTASRRVVRVVAEDATPDGQIILLATVDSLWAAWKSPRTDTINVSGLIGKRTRITSLRNGELIRREVLDSVGANVGMKAREIGGQVDFGLTRFSDKPLPIGGTWSSTKVDTVFLGGGTTITTTNTDYTIAAKEPAMGPHVLRITFTSNSKFASQQKMGANNISVEGTGAVTGTMYFDADRGLSVRSEAKTEQEMTNVISGAQNMTMTAVRSGWATTTRIEN